MSQSQECEICSFQSILVVFQEVFSENFYSQQQYSVKSIIV